MSKSLKELFAKPPPTTYEIEAKNLKPATFVKSLSNKLESSDTTVKSFKDAPPVTEPSTNVESTNKVDRVEGVEPLLANKRKERPDNNVTESPTKKIAVIEVTAEVSHSSNVTIASSKSEIKNISSPNLIEHSAEVSQSTQVTFEEVGKTAQNGRDNKAIVNQPQTLDDSIIQPSKAPAQNFIKQLEKEAPKNAAPQPKQAEKFVSPLDIILGAVNIEKMNAIQERATAQNTQPLPAEAYTQANPNQSNKQKKKGQRKRKKQQQKKKAERDHYASMNHADRPFGNNDVEDKDVDELFSEFEELKAKKEKAMSAASHNPTNRLPAQNNNHQLKNNPHQGKNNQQQNNPHQNGHKSNHQQNNNHQNGHKNNQGNKNQGNNTHYKTVSNDTLPDFHLPTNDDQTKPVQKTPFVPRKVCSHFLKGHCHAGDKCTFKHERPDDMPPPPPPATSKIVCQFYKTGACTQFDNCKFSHDLKIEPCRFFHMSGSCEHGDRCMYSHEPLNDDRLKRLRTLTGPCRFYHFKGYCNNPDTCLFSHDEASADQLKEVESTIKPCRFYHVFKNCAKGNDCFYAHDEASPLQVQQLLEAEKRKV